MNGLFVIVRSTFSCPCELIVHKWRQKGEKLPAKSRSNFLYFLYIDHMCDRYVVKIRIRTI